LALSRHWHMSAFGSEADMTSAEIRFRGCYWAVSGHRFLHAL
jgi:hypothetical protein